MIQFLACLLALLAVTARPVPAADPSAPPSREAIEQIVRDYLIAHPEVIAEALRALEDRQQAEQRQRLAEAIRAHRDELLADPGAPVGGNAQGDVTVVEFFDYRCPHCRHMAPTVTQLVRDDSKIRRVYKELPILGPESVFAARAALAAHAQGKYGALHEALMAASEPLTQESIMGIASRVGLDTARLRQDMESSEITARLRRNHALAQALGVRGTPALVVGDELVPGAVDLATLAQLVERARGR